MEKVLEIGISENIFKFDQLFGKTMVFHGLTLDKQEAEKASLSAKKRNRGIDVRIQDVQNDLPYDWKNMDLVLDVYSASHYTSTEIVVEKAAPVLKLGGYLIMVPGGDLGTADYVRHHPEDTTWRQVFRYNSGSSVEVRVDPDIFPQVSERLLVVRELRSAYDLPDDAPDENILVSLDDMVRITGHDTITNLDLYEVQRVKMIEKGGFIDVRTFNTPDGKGFYWL